MSSRRVAVILPVYNRERLVLEALASIAAQTRRPDLVVVVDDGSTDGSAAAVEAWAGAAAGTVRTGGAGGLAVRLIRQANGGVSAARNRGLAEAAGHDVMAFLDSDDLWPADYLERMLAALAASPGAVAASCDMHLLDSVRRVDLRLSMARLRGAATQVLFADTCPIPSGTVVLAEALRAMPGFDTRYQCCEDLELFLRLSLRGAWVHVPGIEVTYRRGTQVLTPGPVHLSEGLERAREAQTRARILEWFVARHGGAKAVSAGCRRGVLAREWHKVGILHLRDRRPVRAIACFKRAVQINPLVVRSRLRLSRSVKTARKLRGWREESRAVSAARAAAGGGLTTARGLEAGSAVPPPGDGRVEPRVAVVVPVYNRPRLVLEALDSIAGQTRRPSVVVVVDDGSTDQTAASVEAWRARQAAGLEVRLVRQANAGVAAARNRGVSEAGACDLLAFLDSDDIWPADYLRRMVEALAAHPAAVAASCDLQLLDQRLGVERVLSASRLTGAATAALFDLYCPNPSSTVVRAAVFHEVGGFDRRYQGIEDHDLFLRLSLHGPWTYVPGLLITYRRGTQLKEPGPDHLNEKMETPEQMLAYAQMLHRFIHEHGGMAAVPRRRRRRHLAKIWHRLGKLYIDAHQWQDAKGCFVSAVREYPLYHRSLLKLIWLKVAH